MTWLDRQRLPSSTFRLDLDGLRHGYYSDKYFINVETILAALRRENYRFNGQPPRELPVDVHGIPIGDIIVEAQIFNRRAPRALIAGVDAALAMIRGAAGHYEVERFVEAFPELDVTAVHDGVFTDYGGNPAEVNTVIEIRGRYQEFALLETPLLGILTRASRIATNVYNVLEAAQGKSVLFFPARFDLPDVQAVDGYAYWLAVQRYNADSGHDVRPLVSTDAQGAWWGGNGGGTVPHALIACFFADTAESMLAFGRHIPVDVPRIALVDFNNDTVRDSLAVVDAFWPEYRKALEAGDETGMKRWTLNAVRLDTAGNMLDASLSNPDDKGVSPTLVRTVREALDSAASRWDVPEKLRDAANEYCRSVQIVVTGGFNRERIERFEAEGVPADVYGVGSTFLTNDKSTNTDFTMDVVRVRIDGQWLDVAKIGRQPGDNPDLQPVNLEKL
jgi:nicotinate phosphoribosyltransferase